MYNYVDLRRAKKCSKKYLFEEIYDYCEDNFIEPTEVEYGVYYSIKDINSRKRFNRFIPYFKIEFIVPKMQ